MKPVLGVNAKQRLATIDGLDPLPSIDVVRFRAREELGRPFRYEIDLDASPHELAPELLGTPVCVTVVGDAPHPRLFHARVSRVLLTGASRQGRTYRLTLRPWLWFLTHRTDCRIFQRMTVPEIIASVFRAEGIERQAFWDFRERLSHTYQTREYCVQYRESDLAFVHRLMEEEGIYYFFEHESDRHTLILADGPASHPPMHLSHLEYVPDRSGRNAMAVIDSWKSRTAAAPGAASFESFDFEDPNKPLGATCEDPADHTLAAFELFDYPGGYERYEDGERLSRLRLEVAQAASRIADATTNDPHVAAGLTFTLNDPDRALPAADRQEHLVIRSDVLIEDSSACSSPVARDRSFRCSFQAIPYTTNFRLPRATPRPLITGPQTAIVVGLAGEEIYTEQHGRVKVQFHWDRYGRHDENSSCWIRVSEAWAGKSWGAQFLPRIGQEVIVEFLEGDPDRPIVTGRVFNGLNKRPWDLPANKTVSGVKTDSSKDCEGFNELRFQDAAGKEQVLLRAQRDHDVHVGNCERHRVIGDRHMLVGWQDPETGEKGGDLYEKVWQDHHAQVMRDEHTWVHGNLRLMVGYGQADDGGRVDFVCEKDLYEAIGESRRTLVEGGSYEYIEKDRLISSKGDQAYVSEAGIQVHAAADLKVKSKQILHIEADQELQISCGSSYIKLTSKGITVSGPMVWVNSSAGEATSSLADKVPGADVQGETAAPTDPTAADSGTHNRVP